MNTRTGPNGSTDSRVKDIRRKTRRRFSEITPYLSTTTELESAPALAARVEAAVDAEFSDRD